MSVRVSVYQPQYFPRLHYINRVLDSDVFVILSSAQYTRSMTHFLPDGQRERRKTYQSHTPIKQHNGEHLLTVPVTSRSKRAPIDEVWPDDVQSWRKLHEKSLDAAYGRADRFDERFDEVRGLLGREPEPLATLNTASLLWAIDLVLGLGIGVDHLSLDAVNSRLSGQHGTRLQRIVPDEQLGVARPEGRQMGSLWTAQICAALGAKEYLYGGTAANGYMNIDDYRARGVTPVQQDWPAHHYPQQFTDRVGFLPNLSVLDLLFHVEPDEAARVLYPTSLMASSGHAHQ